MTISLTPLQLRTRQTIRLRGQRVRRDDQLPVSYRKPIRPTPPDRLIIEYFHILKDITDSLLELTEEHLLPALPRIVAAAEKVRPDDDDARIDEGESSFGDLLREMLKATRDQEGAARLAELFLTSSPYWKTRTDKKDDDDDPTDELRKSMEKMRKGQGKARGEAETRRILLRVAGDVQRFNREQLKRVGESVLGLWPTRSEPWLKKEMDLFVYDNVALIKSIEEDFLLQVEQTVMRGVRGGERHEQLAGEILRRHEVTENRAKLIARDQVNKFNGSLTRVRQKNAGVKEYRWRTAKDTRVRSKHAGREGKRFSWDDPPDGGHPGMAIQCRCYPEPVLDELLAQESPPEERPAAPKTPKTKPKIIRQKTIRPRTAAYTVNAKPPKIGEVDYDRISKAITKIPDWQKPFLSDYSRKEYAAKKARFYLTEDELGGYALTEDNDLISVFSLPGAKHGRFLVSDAIGRGAATLDCIGETLGEMYTRRGFEVYDRIKWDDEYAPKNWDYQQFGRPDILLMRRRKK